MTAWFDVHGDGPAVALVHAGIADSRMWEPQLRTFSEAHRVVRVDLPGFGNSPFESNLVSYRGAIRDALDGAGVDRAAVVGTSLGGRAALEFALESPERVSALVLVGAGIDDHEWSEEVTRFAEEEEAALANGALDAAVTANLQLWIAGPRRSLDEVDPDVRDLVAEMQTQAFRLGKGHDDLQADRLEPAASTRLADVHAPTLVVTGDEDLEDIHAIADRLAREIPGAERATIAHAAHLPSLERPEEFDRIVLRFFGEHGV
jgi:3-oxoadipate enol-lactonase